MTAPSTAAAVIVIGNITLIGLLPFVFFKPGRRTVGWLVTASAFLIAPLLVAAARAGHAGPMLPAGAVRVTEVAGAVACLVSVYVIGVAVGSHRTPIALWHQRDDAPVEIVTWGPYGLVRHPLYTAFLTALVAAVLVVPALPMALAAAFGFVAISRTARREERRLLASHLGSQYLAYMARSGRFLPPVGIFGAARAVTAPRS